MATWHGPTENCGIDGSARGPQGSAIPRAQRRHTSGCSAPGAKQHCASYVTICSEQCHVSGDSTTGGPSSAACGTDAAADRPAAGSERSAEFCWRPRRRRSAATR